MFEHCIYILELNLLFHKWGWLVLFWLGRPTILIFILVLPSGPTCTSSLLSFLRLLQWYLVILQRLTWLLGYFFVIEKLSLLMFISSHASLFTHRTLMLIWPQSKKSWTLLRAYVKFNIRLDFVYFKRGWNHVMIHIYVWTKWKNRYRIINTNILQWKWRYSKHIFY